MGPSCATLAGRIHYMEDFAFGRCGAATLRSLRLVAMGRHCDEQDFAGALDWVVNELPAVKPRRIRGQECERSLDLHERCLRA